MQSAKCCQTCGKELLEGMPVVRIQRGTIHYCKHVGVSRKAATDDYFCEGCQIAVREEI
jgi:hypothetical protein